MLLKHTGRLRDYGISALLLTCTALHPLALHAEADTRHLPDSRYTGDLPSPDLLYPDRTQPLYPQFISPNAAPNLPAPAPISAPKTLPVAMPAPALPTASPAPALEPLPTSPSLLPPPPRPRGAAPQFVPLATLETQRDVVLMTAPAAPDIPPKTLLRQPLALPEQPAHVPAPPPIVEPLRQTLVPPASAVATPIPIHVPEAPAIQEAAAPMEPLPNDEPAAPPPPTIDAETQSILDRIPRGIDSPRKQTRGPTTLSRFAPDIEGVLDKPETAEDSVTRHESMGVAIEIRQPDMDVTSELQDAYEALASGQPQVALQIYQDILDQSPKHPDALFGMATTYHRTGAIDKARPYYIELLKMNPNNRDALINFLSIVAQEAPEEATLRLEYLAKKNPDFSAIPALLGILYKQMGQPEQAIDSMIRAMRMEPENLVYQYNLAIMYDENKMVDDAIILYNRLLAASRSGLTLPVPPRDLQERVIYISETRGKS